MTIVYADRLHSHTVYHLAACASACKRTVVDHRLDVERLVEMPLLMGRTLSVSASTRLEPRRDRERIGIAIEIADHL